MMSIKPPGIKDSWESCNVEAKAMLIGYYQIRDKEDAKEAAALAGVKFA